MLVGLWDDSRERRRLRDLFAGQAPTVVDGVLHPSRAGVLDPTAIIAGYRIESIIGRGGMAVVYRADDLRLRRKVALKLLTAEPRRQRPVPAALHPRVTAGGVARPPEHRPDLRGGRGRRAAVHRDAVRPRQRPEGLLTKESPLSGPAAAAVRPDRATRWTPPTAPGSCTGTSSRPTSCSWPVRSGRRPRDHVYLTDFGLAKTHVRAVEGLTGTGHFLGTVDYVSPEQIQGKPVGPPRTSTRWAACSTSA